MTMTTWEFLHAISPEIEGLNVDVAWDVVDPQIDVDWAHHTAHQATD